MIHTFIIYIQFAQVQKVKEHTNNAEMCGYFQKIDADTSHEHTGPMLKLLHRYRYSLCPEAVDLNALKEKEQQRLAEIAQIRKGTWAIPQSGGLMADFHQFGV